jgi:large subunit ribosomal protein L1
MPNPKAGTVSPDIVGTIKDLKKGKVEFRTDKQAQIHNNFGKVSFDADKLKENLKALLKAIVDSKPAGVKGTYIKGAAIATTMGPGIKLDAAKLMTEL